MPTTFLFRKIIASMGFLGAAFALIWVTTAHAQTISQPNMLITWQAQNSYIPPGYRGKALPNGDSKISASIAVVSPQGQVNLAGQTIYWYEDETLIGSGQSIVFSPFGQAPTIITLKAQIPNYEGAILVHSIQIPVVGPKAVIEANHPTAQFGNNSLALQGTPYFFAVSSPSSLAYTWTVNGSSPSAAIDPQSLALSVNPSTPSGSAFSTQLSITDPKFKITASDATSLTYIK